MAVSDFNYFSDWNRYLTKIKSCLRNPETEDELNLRETFEIIDNLNLKSGELNKLKLALKRALSIIEKAVIDEELKRLEELKKEMINVKIELARLNNRK